MPSKDKVGAHLITNGPKYAQLWNWKSVINCSKRFGNTKHALIFIRNNILRGLQMFKTG